MGSGRTATDFSLIEQFHHVGAHSPLALPLVAQTTQASATANLATDPAGYVMFELQTPCDDVQQRMFLRHKRNGSLRRPLALISLDHLFPEGLGHALRLERGLEQSHHVKITEVHLFIPQLFIRGTRKAPGE